MLATALVDDPRAGFVAKAAFVVAGDDPRPFVPEFSGVSGNLPGLEAAAHGVGAINWIPDRDQVVRRAPLIYRVGNEFMPALAADALRVAQRASTYVLKASNASGETAFGQRSGLNHIRIGKVEIATDASGAVFPRFRPYTGGGYIPAWKVLAGQVPRPAVAGQIVLIGTSAPGLLDLRATPLDAAVPGVEIHAQLLEDILEQPVSGAARLCVGAGTSSSFSPLGACWPLCCLAFGAASRPRLGLLTVFGRCARRRCGGVSATRPCCSTRPTRPSPSSVSRSAIIFYCVPRRSKRTAPNAPRL